MSTSSDCLTVGFSKAIWRFPRHSGLVSPSMQEQDDLAPDRRRTQAVDALIDLSEKAGEIADDECRWPSRDALKSASMVVSIAHEQGLRFDRVVSDGEGGVSLEIRQVNRLVRLRIDDDGKIAVMRFENSRLISHEEIAVKSC